MIPNKAKLDFLGITKYHELGYKGDGVTIASREGNVSTHGAMVEDVIRQIVPNANIQLKVNYQKGTNADIYTTSSFQVSDGYKHNADKAHELHLNNVFLCCAVGNDGSEKQTTLSKYPWWNAIGACDLVKGEPRRMYYSSITDGIDFMSFTNFDTAKGRFTGTSCATPVFASMCALVQQIFIKRTGRKLTNYNLFKFILDNTKDLQDSGHDTKTGYGIFVLPDPKAIDFEKYIIEEEEDMIMYDTIEEVPDWGKEAVDRAIGKGILKGTGNGLGLTKTELKMLVWLDRCGLFNKPHPQENDIVLPEKE